MLAVCFPLWGPLSRAMELGAPSIFGGLRTIIRQRTGREGLNPCLDLHFALPCCAVVGRRSSFLRCSEYIAPIGPESDELGKKMEDGSHEPASINLLSLCWPMRRGRNLSRRRDYAR